MSLKIIKRLYGQGSFIYSTSDAFVGKRVTKTRIIGSKKCSGPTKYGGIHIVTMLPGAPPGPKIMGFIKDVFKAAYVPVDFEEIPFEKVKSVEEFAKFKNRALASIYRNGVGIKGNISTTTAISEVSLREELDLFVCIVHIKSYQNVKCKYPNMDFYICRQNTEGEYAMLEYSAMPGIVESLKVITADNTARFAEWCFEFATQRERKKVTIVHKANIMKLSDGLFMKVVKDVAKSYPNIKVNDLIVDNCVMQMVQDPRQFDVIVTPNLYGNILSSIACGLSGGPGLMSGRNYGHTCALFEPGTRHLSFLGDDVNPTAMLNAAIHLLKYLGKTDHAKLIHLAIQKTLSEDKIHTHDIGGTHSGAEMVESVKVNIKELLKTSNIQIF